MKRDFGDTALMDFSATLYNSVISRGSGKREDTYYNPPSVLGDS